MVTRAPSRVRAVAHGDTHVAAVFKVGVVRAARVRTDGYTSVACGAGIAHAASPMEGEGEGCWRVGARAARAASVRLTG